MTVRRLGLILLIGALAAAPARAQRAKPNVAILVYDGVQVDDHTIPFEVDSGKVVGATGSGIEGSLAVDAELHGRAWAEVVRLNMEYEPMPASLHVPRVALADMDMPDGIYDGSRAVMEQDGWRLVDEDRAADRWTSRWAAIGHDGQPVEGEIGLLRAGGTYDLDLRVRRGPITEDRP